VSRRTDAVNAVCARVLETMQETLKVVCVVGIMFGGVAAAFAWSDNKPNVTPRLASSAATLVGLVGFLVLHFRRDRVPDFLRKYSRIRFERAGLCFSVEPTIKGNCCYLRVLFQNRYEGRCHGRIALRPAEVFGTFARSDFQAITFDFDCPAAGFGVALLPLPIPSNLQGRRQAFQVGATVEYPNGKGRLLRFGSERVLTVRSNADFRNPFYRRLTIIAALTGSILISRPARIALLLPNNVAESVPGKPEDSQTILWQLGDDSELSPEATLAIRDPN